MGKLFTVNDVWHGGFYELDYELPTASQTAVNDALAKLWNVPMLEGCFLRSDLEPTQQPKVSPLNTEKEGHLFGIAKFPGGRKCACGSVWGNFEDCGCWMTLYLPLGSLGTIFPVKAYPIYSNNEASPEVWLKEVNNWLKDIATNIYPQIKYNIALIGFEIDPFDVKKKLTEGIPNERWEGILLPDKNNLTWYPPTNYEPPFRLKKRLR